MLNQAVMEHFMQSLTQENYTALLKQISNKLLMFSKKSYKYKQHG
jgi:hypothetical protein